MDNDKKQEIESSFLMWIRSELSQRMAQNLPFIKIEPEQILLDQPVSSTAIGEIEKIYPKAQWTANFQVKKTYKEKLLWFIPPRIKPMNLGMKFDLVWSCQAALKNSSSTEQLVSNWVDVVADNGLLMMAYLGPDTAKEYHQFLDEKPPLIDMHDLGDLLVHKGFSDPVMTMEYITLEYDNSTMLQKELNALLGLSEKDQESNTLTETMFRRVNHPVKDKWQLTLEVVYGHAWKIPRMKNNVVSIDAKSIKTKKSS